MKRTIFIILSLLVNYISLTAQNGKPVTVKAGERIQDYFPFEERYRYPVFTKGYYVSRNGKTSPDLFNYNFLSGEMEFIRSADTMIITNKKDLKYIVIGQDTNYFHNGYMEMIHGGQLKVYLNQRIVIKEILRKGAMGTVNRNSSSESLDLVVSGGVSYNMVLDEDIVFQRTCEYFFSNSLNDFVPFTKKNIIKTLPEKEDVIKSYIKSENIDFESRKDLLKLADFVSNLLVTNSNTSPK